MDAEALAAWTGRSRRTIQRRCTPATTDPTTGANLYDAEASRETLLSVPMTKAQKAARDAALARRDPETTLRHLRGLTR